MLPLAVVFALHMTRCLVCDMFEKWWGLWVLLGLMAAALVYVWFINGPSFVLEPIIP
jgi:hypothetical protein